MNRTMLIMLVCLMLLSAGLISAETSITLERVDGLYNSETISCQARFLLRYTNNSDTIFGGISNGYRVWTKLQSPIDAASIDTLPVAFTPLTGWRNNFDLVIWLRTTQMTPSEYLLYLGASRGATYGGLVAWFDHIAVAIDVTYSGDADTLCLDSSFYPPNPNWLWAGGVANSTPAWGGPYCFASEFMPCGYPEFTNCADTLFRILSDPVSLQFHANTYQGQPGEVRYQLREGRGIIDSLTGVWTATVSLDETGTPIPLTIAATGAGCTLCNATECASTLLVYLLGDVNLDHSFDIGDLLYLVEYQFGSGPAPIREELADMDNSGSLDIGDVVYLVNYMFDDGPPPVNPWP